VEVIPPPPSKGEPTLVPAPGPALQPITSPPESGPKETRGPEAPRRLVGTSDQALPHASWIFTPPNSDKTATRADKLSQALLPPEPDPRAPAGNGSILR